jgi:hypothetical protein
LILLFQILWRLRTAHRRSIYRPPRPCCAACDGGAQRSWQENTGKSADRRGDNEQSGRANITLSAGGSAVLPSILRLLPIIFWARITVFILPRKVAQRDNLPQGKLGNKPFDSVYLSLLCDEIINC